MNIVYNCDDGFAVHTAVSIASLFETNQNADSIEVFILGNGLKAETRERFMQLAESFSMPGRQRNITIIELADYQETLKRAFGGEIDTRGFNPTVLARLFAPQHLPEEIDRYLYLDSDTVVLGDIAALYAAELGNNICAMAAEPTIYAQTRAELGLTDDMPYYNSGVILTDRQRWEKEDISRRCIEYYASEGRGGLDFPDQDILNYVLKGRVTALWPGWNFFSNYHYRSYRSLTANAAWYGALVNREDYDRARRHPAVVHFAGAERPWLRGNHNPYRNSYHRYLALTPWRHEGDKTGQETAMLMYHCMNLLTEVCPPLRRLISGLYLGIRKRRTGRQG